MHDIKNFYLAWVASVPYLTAIETHTLISLVSAIVLPIVFFAIGKTADILLQIYFENKRQKPDR
jgi:hypothetical protein